MQYLPGHLFGFSLHRSRTALAAVAGALLVALGCEGVSHENLDRWRNTEKGPGKLEDALQSDEHSAELRAHAAQNLVQIDRFEVVREAFAEIPEAQHKPILTVLAPRLWEDARVEGELTVPSAVQAAAKDALFELRRYADDETRDAIDQYLVEWYTSGYYEGRAKSGLVTGSMVMRTVGPAAAPKLLESARSILARPPDEEGSRLRLGDELLSALAFSGDAEALGFVLDLVKSDRGDDTLPMRAMGALVTAYVSPVGIEAANGKALVPILDRLAAFAQDEELPGTINNDAVELIAVAGMPECLPHFVEMVSFPHTQDAFRWMATQRGLRCGLAKAVVPVVEAIPASASYERGILEKYVWDDIVRIPARGKVAQAARTLLESDSWVSRATGIEILGKLAIRADAAADAERIRALAGDSTRLRGWWGDQKDVAAAERKRDPTLGQIAARVAKRLQGVAKGTETE